MKFDEELKQSLSKQALITAVITCLLIVVIAILNKPTNSSNSQLAKYEQSFAKLSYSDPLDSLLVLESITLLEKDSVKAQTIFTQIKDLRSNNLLNRDQLNKESVNTSSVLKLTGMFIEFTLVFLVVLILSYFLVQGFAIRRFKAHMLNKPNMLQIIKTEFNLWKSVKKETLKTRFFTSLKRIGKIFLKALTYLVLMSPGFVIAYFFKSKLDTSNILFMILLAISTNGLLLIYVDKYFNILLNESKKGYVLTSVVKNLNRNYVDISSKQIFAIKKYFPNHVFQHIYANAQLLYISSFKEQASFLISCLIIIEMALNIQGNLSYELMQHILYENHALVAVIILGIFLVVKSIDVLADIWLYNYKKQTGYLN